MADGAYNFLEVVPYVGTWIEIIFGSKQYYKSSSRSLRGNVDRNLAMPKLGQIIVVVPYVGTWIEIGNV